MFEHASQNPSLAIQTSSEPIPIPTEQQKLFREVLALLERNGIAYAVAGAFALRAHTGIYRDTKDLDLFLTAENALMALDCLRENNFHCEICDPVWLYKARRDSFFVDLITGMSNGVVLVEDSWVERAIPAEIEGVHAKVLGAEELLVSKLFVTRRERFDGADIAHVIYGTRGKLEWARVLSLIGEQWEILFWALVLFRYAYPAQTNYVPEGVWRELITRFQHSVFHPDANARFRGSLIDENMFAIDVKEWGLENLLAEFRNRRLQMVAAIRQVS
jgi:predicted nucleotidyltransferase